MTTKPANARQTRQQLIDVGADLLCRRGYTGFSYQDLARELGISKPSVHHHFAQKADLGLALCDWTEQWLRDGFAHFDQYGQNAPDKLQRYLRAAAKHTFNEHKQCPLSALHSDLAQLPDAMRARLSDLSRLEVDWVAAVFSQGLADGELQAPATASAQELAQLFIFACKGALYYARLLGREHFEQSMSLLLQQWLPDAQPAQSRTPL